MAIVTLDIDRANNVFALHGVDVTGRALVVRARFSDATLLQAHAGKGRQQPGIGSRGPCCRSNE